MQNFYKVIVLSDLEYIFQSCYARDANLTNKDSQPCCKSLPIMLALRQMLLGIYCAKNYASMISLGIARGSNL